MGTSLPSTWHFYFLQRLCILQIKTGKLKDKKKQNLKTEIDQLIIKMICKQIWQEDSFRKTDQTVTIFTY